MTREAGDATVTEKLLMKGNEAVSQGCIDGGCTHFFGYPITPQNQICEYMAVHLREAGGVFLQAESEVSAINMVFGCAAAGGRPVTSSSGPGISLKQEGISYIIGADLPCVIINVARGGPGLGNIAAAQSDYFLATRGGGHGDGRCIVVAPDSVQEMYDLGRSSVALADKYRNPVMILSDAILGQMMEPMVRPGPVTDPPPQKPWATTGRRGGPRRVVNSLYIVPEDLEAHSRDIVAKYDRAAQEDCHWEEFGSDDPDVLVCAYGTSARVAKAAVMRARNEGRRARLMRPITLFPFPGQRIAELAERVRAILVVEMSLGQFVEDVRLSVEGRTPVRFYGRTGGILPMPEAVLEEIRACEAAEGQRQPAVAG
jgi:2-oxoglutarate ferredoxin oxidoreductase subunit alpha